VDIQQPNRLLFLVIAPGVSASAFLAREGKPARSLEALEALDVLEALDALDAWSTVVASRISSSFAETRS
jgi:hypothetical protein